MPFLFSLSSRFSRLTQEFNLDLSETFLVVFEFVESLGEFENLVDFRIPRRDALVSLILLNSLCLIFGRFEERRDNFPSRSPSYPESNSRNTFRTKLWCSIFYLRSGQLNL